MVAAHLGAMLYWVLGMHDLYENMNTNATFESEVSA
jgi:hypothetical protein